MEDAGELKDGYYLLGGEEATDICLVYLYDCPDFNGVRHLAFGPADGSALMPITDLKDSSILIPVRVVKSEDRPMSNADLTELFQSTVETKISDTKPHCPGCGTWIGELHVSGCKEERCATCGLMYRGCSCLSNQADRVPWDGIPFTSTYNRGNQNLRRN